MAGTRPDPSTVTRLLRRCREGNESALGEIFRLVYEELRGLAARERGRFRGSATLDTTALVHEAYLRLADQRSSHWKDRAHFRAVAAKAMRSILIDAARRRQAQKRGGGRRRVSLEEVGEALRSAPAFSVDDALALVTLDESLQRLARRNEEACRVVECRFFGGMTVKETAEALSVSPATVKRRWSLARTWLYRDLRDRLD